MNDNDMSAIDRKIDEVANDNLDGLEDSLNHTPIEVTQQQIKDMVDDCSKKELKEVLKLLIKQAKASLNN
jgi:hypothetical protein|tara:strand:- start:235 stop:444 length:210 start_codon:yes stop_codon:yes gene_type:complete